MGQKTNPIGLRVAVNKDWRSKWYATKKDFSALVVEDNRIRTFLKKKLEGRQVTAEDVLDATDYVTPAIEIIDARIEQFDRHTKAMRKVYDTISDNAASAGIITGGRPVKPDSVDLRWVGALLYRNGVIEESGLAAAVLNHPAAGVAWLANKLAPWDECLEQGEVVLAGSFTRPVNAAAGDTFHADYGPLGSIAFRFT